MRLEEFKKLNVGDKVQIKNDHTWNTSTTIDCDIVDDYPDMEYEILSKEAFTVLVKYTTEDDCTDCAIFHWLDIVSKELDTLNQEVLDNIKYTLNKVYPSTHDITVGTSEIAIQLYFPESIISNDSGLSHIIYDMFIKLIFNRNGTLKRIEGTRSTMTDVEVNRGYCHSHVSSSLCTYTSNVCFGHSTDIVMAKDELTQGYDEEIFEAFLYMFEDFMVHESIKGGPYNGGLNHLFMKNPQLPRAHTSSSMVSTFKRKIPELKIHISDNNDLNEIAILDNDELEKNIYDIFKDEYAGSVVIKRGNSYLNVETSQITDSQYQDMCIKFKNKSITFQGKTFPAKIIRSEKKKIESDDSFCMHPEIKKYIIAKLTLELNDFYNKEYCKVA